MEQGFVVDTHLLRELGDLLVGRDSTAILELVKNGYDADATDLRVEARHLADPSRAAFIVSDNGTGMTMARFQSAFLTIAGRAKEVGERKSQAFGRAYTGQKGIGRLASQKLARELEVTSSPLNATSENPGVRARLNWDVIDEQERLDRLAHGLEVSPLDVGAGVPTGTTLVMRRLKRAWSNREIALFVNEMKAAQPPENLMTRASDLLADEPLFDVPQARTSGVGDPGFKMTLAGDLESGDDLWSEANERFDWCVEIDVGNGRARYQITPTLRYVAEVPLARRYNFEADAPRGLEFQARFFFMPNASSRGPLGGFVRSESGIRVYLEGFRVLPYGEYGDDWLGTDADYRSGPRLYSIELDEVRSDVVFSDSKEGLNTTSSTSYFGAVFLTSRGAPNLESLINREGFVPSPTFQAIRDITRDAIRLSVRVRRSVFLQERALQNLPRPIESAGQSRAGDSKAAAKPDTRPSAVPRAGYELMTNRGLTAEAKHSIERATNFAEELQETNAENRAAPEVAVLVDGFNAVRRALDSVLSVQSELRTLAGVGLQIGAFVHDINGMLGTTTTIRQLLQSVVEQTTDREHRKRLRSIVTAAEELSHTLSRQSSYLTDVLSSDPRRRRSRLDVLERVDAVVRFLGPRLLERNIAVRVDVVDGLRTPPMFPSEMTILLTNLLTNAAKNAASTIWIKANTDEGGNTVVVISNDGVRVDLEESERWFLPFESTTTSVDEILGQGLGLGLPIVRAIADDYDGDVRFVEPSDGVTAIQVWLKKKDR